MSDSPLKLAKLRAETEALKTKVLDTQKYLFGLVKEGVRVNLNDYIEFTQKLDERTQSEGARSMGHFALIIALEAFRLAKELQSEQREMRKRMEEIAHESAIRNKPESISVEERPLGESST